MSAQHLDTPESSLPFVIPICRAPTCTKSIRDCSHDHTHTVPTEGGLRVLQEGVLIFPFPSNWIQYGSPENLGTPPWTHSHQGLYPNNFRAQPEGSITSNCTEHRQQGQSFCC